MPDDRITDGLDDIILVCDQETDIILVDDIPDEDVLEDIVLELDAYADIVLEDDDTHPEDITLECDDRSDIILVDDLPYPEGYDYYTGEYVVTPILDYDQVLETNDKVMKDDVTVKPIPIVYTSNPYNGKTVVIG